MLCPWPSPIDHFLNSHRADPRIVAFGKLAIGRCILAAESKSVLYTMNNDGDFSKLESTSYNAFFRILTENCQVSDLPERFAKIALISFNYDRCIEEYLYWALQCYYRMKSARRLRHHSPRDSPPIRNYWQATLARSQWMLIWCESYGRTGTADHRTADSHRRNRP